MDIMQLAANFGFPALMSVFLLMKGWAVLNRIATAMDRNTRAINMLVLRDPFLPPAFKQQAQELENEVKDANKPQGGHLT